MIKIFKRNKFLVCGEISVVHLYFAVCRKVLKRISQSDLLESSDSPNPPADYRSRLFAYQSLNFKFFLKQLLLNDSNCRNCDVTEGIN